MILILPQWLEELFGMIWWALALPDCMKYLKVAWNQHQWEDNAKLQTGSFNIYIQFCDDEKNEKEMSLAAKS